jgi:sporulation protein YlmC with PRC-barrel domain
VRLSELLGLEVSTESGEQLGHVHDLRADLTSRSVRVRGILVGKIGLLERLGLGAPHSTFRRHGQDLVPWSAVVRADRRGVVVKHQAKPR